MDVLFADPVAVADVVVVVDALFHGYNQCCKHCVRVVCDSYGHDRSLSDILEEDQSSS